MVAPASGYSIMDIARALTIAADGADVSPAGLRAIAQALKKQGRLSVKRARSSGTAMPRSPPTFRDDAEARLTNLQATQASRSLLVRTIAMLK